MLPLINLYSDWVIKLFRTYDKYVHEPVWNFHTHTNYENTKIYISTNLIYWT